MLQPSKQHRQMDQRLGMNSPECISNSTSLATPQYHNTPVLFWVVSWQSPRLLSSTLPPFLEGSKVSSALVSDVFPSLAHPAEPAAITFCSAPPRVAAVLVEMRENVGRERQVADRRDKGAANHFELPSVSRSSQLWIMLFDATTASLLLRAYIFLYIPLDQNSGKTLSFQV